MVVESQSQPRRQLPSRPLDQEQPLQGQLPPQLRDSTVTDGASRRTWLGHEEVIQLREWGTETVHRLPQVDGTERSIGSGPSAWLRLVDPDGHVSRNHARLVREGPDWRIENLQSKNGICQDNEYCNAVVLVPGVEIGIGGVTLVAENQPLVHLRGYLMRVLGWDLTTAPAVDLALREIRAAANQRTPLLIAGADDVVAVARQIHRRTQGQAAPFVVCSRRSSETDLALRVSSTQADPAAALELASGGTVCVRTDRLPNRFTWLMTSVRNPRARAQLVVCSRETPERPATIAPSFVVPALADRTASDVGRIVFEYAFDAIRELNAEETSFTAADGEWVVSHEATSFADIETTTLRIVALRESGNVHRAAKRLGLSHVALGKWLKRRRLAL